MSGRVRSSLRWVLGVAGLVALVAAFSWLPRPTPQVTAAEESGAASPVRLLEIAADGVTAEIQAGAAGAAEVELYDLAGKLLAKALEKHEGGAVVLRLTATLDPKDPSNYYVRFRSTEQEEYQQRSLYFMSEILETTVLGHREMMAGTKPVLRVLVRDRAGGTALPGASVRLALKHKDRTLAEQSGTTDARGELAVALPLPAEETRGATLTVNVSTKTAQDSVEQTVDILSATRTMLTSDKPLYQPGQTIHMRALSLRRPEMKPLTGADVTFEVEDAKGNKVFRKAVKTDDFGVSFADFVLADELNKGTYRIRAIAGGAREEKTVTVDRYVLPKFKLRLETDRKFYQPGETVQADLQVDYFFGKPVAGGKVKVTCSKFDVEFMDFQTIDGKTDAQGHYAFEVKLPDHFVGQPLEAGKASARLKVEVTDTADHKETSTTLVSVTAAPILIAAVPESGELVPNLANKVYIVTTYADSTPAECQVTWMDAPGGKTVTVRTDEAGFGEVELAAEAGASVKMTLSARDEKGATGKAVVDLKPKEKQDDSILLRTNRSLYRVGDSLQIAVTSTRKAGTAYVDVIKDGQTYLTRTLDLKDGRAASRLELAPDLAGTLQVNAYLIGANGVIVRDRRLVIVDPADDLKVTVAGDRDTYLPGQPAKVTFAVTDKRGRGVAAALGVMVVDEAVFALQEMQPGLEKVYFYLEKEIATPRYEVHGYTLEEVFGPVPIGSRPVLEARRDAAAKVLLASAKGAGEYSIHVNTFQQQDKAAAFQQKMFAAMQGYYRKVQQALEKYRQSHAKDARKRTEGIDLDVLVKEDFLKQRDILDPWGNPMKIQGGWCQGCQTYHGFVLLSAGIDGKEGTADDIVAPAPTPVLRRGGLGGEGVPDFAMNEAMPMQFKAAAAPAAPPGEKPAEAPAAEPVRIRQYFPETLYFNPAVISDASGKAVLEIPMADSITTWRLTCMANSAAGQLGSTTAGLRVFQEFFVDIDFPVALTQNDEIDVPVAVYNYLKTDQEIRLTVTKEDWFDLKGDAEKTIKLAGSEVRAVYFPIVARKVGFQKFTVTARGSSRSDAVSRAVEIVPDGKEVLANHCGRLEGRITHGIEIPKQAIEGASKIFVKIYPGTLSQVVEGLDNMLRMPFGCFEQTSSVTYPNILVLDYMKTTGKVTPELQMKAEGFINAGYQRLLSFECKGGGFEWFGNPPAHRILTAYGLMEFHDMSKVYTVDPAVIARTQQWLAGLQEKDGSWKPGEGGIQEGAINKFTNDTFRTTAYVTWALAATGYQGPQVEKGLSYLRQKIDEIEDPYTLALTANTFATVEPKGKTTEAIVQRLLAKKVEKDDYVYWPASAETPTHGSGDCADIEVTGLAVQALVRAGLEPGVVSKAVTYLAKKRDAYGTWQSTQATIQALRAMLMAEREATALADATIDVIHNGKVVQTLRVDKSNSDVLQLVDLKDRTAVGANDVVLEMKGKGSMMYQVVGRYYVPYAKETPHLEEPISIRIEYDRSQLAVEDIATVTATVTNNRAGRAQMVIVDLGLPPGFTLLPEELNRLVENKTIEKYSTTGRQIIIYLRELAGGKPVTIKYQLLAKYPLKAKTAKAVVYEYYNPDIRAETAPVELVVSKSAGGKDK